MIRALALAAVVLAASGCNRSDESSGPANGEAAATTSPSEKTAHVTPAAPIDATPVPTDKIALQVIGMT